MRQPKALDVFPPTRDGVSPVSQLSTTAETREQTLVVPVLKILINEIATLTERLESSLDRLEAHHIAEAEAAKRQWIALFSKSEG